MASLHEIESYWTVQDVFDGLEALAVKSEIEAYMQPEPSTK